LPLSKVQDLADTSFAQKISQLPGVGLVSLSGGQKPAVRIQATDGNGVLRISWNSCGRRWAVNVDLAKGQLDGARQTYTINSNDQLYSQINIATS